MPTVRYLSRYLVTGTNIPGWRGSARVASYYVAVITERKYIGGLELTLMARWITLIGGDEVVGQRQIHRETRRAGSLVTAPDITRPGGGEGLNMGNWGIPEKSRASAPYPPTGKLLSPPPLLPWKTEDPPPPSYEKLLRTNSFLSRTLTLEGFYCWKNAGPYVSYVINEIIVSLNLIC